MARRRRDDDRRDVDAGEVDEVFDFEDDLDLDLDDRIDFGDDDHDTRSDGGGAGDGSGTGDLGADGEGNRSRWVVIALVVAIVAVGVGLSWAFPAETPPTSAGGADVEQVWICPDTPGGGKPGSGTVSVLNLTEADMAGSVSFVPGDGEAAPEPQQITVKAFGRATVNAADAFKGRPGAAVVTLPPGAVAVAQQVTRTAEDPKGVAALPCASTSSTEWLFASGSTKAGRQQSLILVNPSQDTAIVDVTFRTEAGEERPEKGSGISLAPRSQRVLDVDADLVIRRDSVATIVRTERGRVVAAQRLSTDGAAGFGEGLGAPTPSATSFLTGGRNGGGQSQSIGLLNGTGDPGSYTVTVYPDQEGQIVPPLIDQTLDPGGAVAVDLTEIGADTTSGYGIEATVPSAVDQVRGFENGRAYVQGAPRAAQRWALPASSDDARGDSIEVLNPGSEAVDVDVFGVRADGGDRLVELGDGFTLPGGTRVTVTLSDLKAPQGPMGVVVSATSNVVASRVFAASNDRAVEVGSPLD